MTISEALVVRLRGAASVAVLTGAGISAESGLPTFRDPQTGLWAKYRPEDLATPQAFRRDPKLVWEWYAWRRSLVAGASPNAGHAALVELERRVARFTLVTQNVDGLHQRAGSSDVVELHGNITRTRCFDDNRLVARWDEDGAVPPRCPRCGGLLRPDVVWFGEALPADAIARAYRAAQTSDVFMSIGTSGIVEPAASLAVTALDTGATVVVVNVQPQANLDRLELAGGPERVVQLVGPSGDVLPALVRAVWP